MTEYTSSPEAIREFMTSRERTAVWVRSHAPIQSQFYSPSVLPSVLDDVSIPSTPPSEVESTRSIPPKMILKYTDGRPDVPISPWQTENNGLSRSGTKRRTGDSTSRSQTLPYEHNGRSRSASHGATEVDRFQRNVSVRHNELQHILGSPTPEEIRVWPSHDTPPPHSQHTPRSRSLPRNAHLQEDIQPPPLPVSSHAQLQHGMFSPSSHSHHAHPTTPTQVSISHSQPLAWHSLPSPSKNYFVARSSQSSSQKSSHTPPAIVYAPSHHSKTHYVPPAMYTHPPPNAPGMSHSHSAPARYAHGGTPYPSAHGGSTVLSSVHEERRRGSHDRSLVAAAAEHDDDSSETSRESGSTYYVLPTAGQKVHIIAPDRSIYTSTSTTKSPTSARSPASGSFKKPFLARLFEKLSVADSSKGSSRGGSRRLQRRHSTGGTERNPMPIDPRRAR